MRKPKYPMKTAVFPQVTPIFLLYTDLDSHSAVIGNALGHSTIGAGPSTYKVVDIIAPDAFIERSTGTRVSLFKTQLPSND